MVAATTEEMLVGDATGTTAAMAASMYETANALCDESHGCRDYHGTWGLLRWLGLNPSILLDAVFFTEALTAAAKQGLREVLVSAAADHAMVALVAAGYRQAGVEPVCTMIDRCPTPLAASRAYAEQIGLSLQTVTGDFTERAATLPPTDLICTHSFLPFFPAKDQPDVVRAWYALLRPGGRLVTWHPETPLGRPKAAEVEDGIAAFGRQIRAAARRHAGWLPCSPEELAEQVIRDHLANPGKERSTTKDVHDMLTDAGFRIDVFRSVARDDRDVGPYSYIRQRGGLRIIASVPD